MKIKIMALGEGEGAQVTLGFFSDDNKLHHSSISLPAEEAPKGGKPGDTFTLTKTTKRSKKE